MSQEKLKVYFLGSGAFAAPALEALLHAKGMLTLGVGTQPDRPAGRRRQLTPTPVGRRAEELGVACERIPSVNEEGFLERLETQKPDLIIVVSFGQLLKERILKLPRLGCLNIHGSLLPKHRGASPIAAAILAGDREAGVAFMRMDKGLDTGPVFCSYALPLKGIETTHTLEAALATLAASKLEEVCLGIASGSLREEPQNNALATVSKKIKKQDGSLVWREDSTSLLRKVRAYQPWPGTQFRMNSTQGVHLVKIVEAALADGSGEPGRVLKADGRDLIVACGKGAISIKRLTPEGKREMSVSDFLHGARLEPGGALLDGPPPKTDGVPGH